MYGCEGGSGTVELRAGSITGRLLDSITITVRTPTPTPTPVTPSGELSATKTSIVVGDEVTVSAVNVVPSDQSVYIVTNGRLGFAGPGTCHFEINPRSSEKSTRSWTLEGCSPPGSGSVTLKTRHNGQTLVLDSITIDVSPAPTATPTPNRPLPTATPPAVSNLVATASTTSVRLTWNDLDGATKYRVEHRLSPSTGSWTPVDTTANVRNVANLTPETSYAFRIRAYGDGTTFRAEWGAEAATTASTVGTVTLAKPPAPGGLSAPSSGENSVSVSWTALTGADKYEVQYRQGSSGNWTTYKNDITGTSPTVDGLQCDTGCQFRVRAYGDGVTYLADWGAWSSASNEVRTSTCPTPTPTPTATPTPSNPTGSISASPAKIAVGQTTTITASWDNVTSTPKIRFGPQLAQTCSGPPAPGTPHTEIVAVETLTLTGCGDTATVTVQLWDVDSNESLAAVNVAVLPLPTITTFDRAGYRYFTVGFSTHVDYRNRVVLQWRNTSGSYTTFRTLGPTDDQDGPPGRAILNDGSTGAAIRGLPYGEGVVIEVRVVGTTGRGLVVEGPAYPVSRSSQPIGIGHLPDHVMMYDDTDLEDSSEGIAEWVKENAASAASRWASIVSGLESCKGTADSVDEDCPQNSDGSVVKVVIGICLNPAFAACYSVGSGSIERKLDGETKLIFLASPPWGEWTDNPDLDGEEVRGQPGETYQWFGNVLVHEFGHAFGLADQSGGHRSGVLGDGREYDGIMRDLVEGDDTIKDHDKAALRAIYETHIKGQGW